MISIEKTLLLDRRMRALTSLDGAAFVKLEKRFARVLAEELATRTRAGQPRRRAAGAGPKGVLPSARAQLFFILFYLKAYPVRDVMGHLFGLSQPQVCARVAQLLPLPQTLLQAHCRPGTGAIWRKSWPTCPSSRKCSLMAPSAPSPGPSTRDGANGPRSRTWW